MKKLFRWLFLNKEIVSKKGVVHFQRWTILNVGIFGIFIHKIYEPDADKHLHSHPWDYFTLILKGGYEEKSCKYGIVSYTNMLPMMYSFGDPQKYNKINQIFSPTTTFFVRGIRKYYWGYLVDNIFVNHEQYRKNKHLGLYD